METSLSDTSPTPPRYCPERPLPSQAYCPGVNQRPTESLATGDSASDLAYAVDLWNHGYYWEAHEVWEQQWIAAGRQGPWADLLKGWIKLAAAGVKLRAKQSAGARHHAQRAEELFDIAKESWTSTPSIPPVTWNWNEFTAVARSIQTMADNSPLAIPVDGPIELLRLSWQSPK